MPACAGTTTRYASGDDPDTVPAVGNVADATAKTIYPLWLTFPGRDSWAFTAPAVAFPPNCAGPLRHDRQRMGMVRGRI